MQNALSRDKYKIEQMFSEQIQFILCNILSSFLV